MAPPPAAGRAGGGRRRLRGEGGPSLVVELRLDLALRNAEPAVTRVQL